MHYHLEVWIPSDKNIEALVKREMEPFVEEYQDENQKWQTNENGWWDWYEIGGRYRSRHGDGIDIIPIAEISEDLTTYKLMLGEKFFVMETRNPEWNYEKHGFQNEGVPYFLQTWDGKVKTIIDEMHVVEGYLVTVDYHS